MLKRRRFHELARQLGRGNYRRGRTSLRQAVANNPSPLLPFDINDGSLTLKVCLEGGLLLARDASGVVVASESAMLVPRPEMGIRSGNPRKYRDIAIGDDEMEVIKRAAGVLGIPPYRFVREAAMKEAAGILG